VDKLLAFLTPEENAALFAEAPSRVFAREEVVVQQNTALVQMFLIERGSVAIERDNGPQFVELAILCRGELFGELSFIDGEPTSARVIAREPTEVKVLGPERIAQMNEADPTFSARFYRSLASILAERLRKTSLNVW
jgi:CRP-like cAMP-binding protein